MVCIVLHVMQHKKTSYITEYDSKYQIIDTYLYVVTCKYVTHILYFHGSMSHVHSPLRYGVRGYPPPHATSAGRIYIHTVYICTWAYKIRIHARMCI